MMELSTPRTAGSVLYTYAAYTNTVPPPIAPPRAVMPNSWAVNRIMIGRDSSDRHEKSSTAPLGDVAFREPGSGALSR